MKVRISFDKASLPNVTTFLHFMRGSGWGDPESFDKPLDIIYVVGPAFAIQSSLGQTHVGAVVGHVMSQAGVSGKVWVLP